MTTEKELGKALKEGQDTIEIEMDLCKKVIKIKVMGKVAWGICIASATIAVSCAVVAVSTAGTTAVPDALIATPAMATLASVLGLPTAISAVAIAVAGGGVGALNKLRNYRLERVSDEKIILHKK